MSEYRVYLNDEMLCKTEWPPIAQAAWDRATRDRDSAQHGGEALLMVDGKTVSSVQPRTGAAHPWPVNSDAVVGLRDVAKAVVMLARVAGVSQPDLADALTASGLPTTSSHLKSISTTEAGRRTSTCSAELVSICYAAVGVLRDKQ